MEICMNNRLKQQLDFALEIDKEKNIFRQTTCRGTEEMKMMPNTHGIWLSWHICCRNIPMSL